MFLGTKNLERVEAYKELICALPQKLLQCDIDMLYTRYVSFSVYLDVYFYCLYVTCYIASSR